MGEAPAGFDASAPNDKSHMREDVYIKKMLDQNEDLFEYLDGWTEKRRENARIYRELFAEKGIEGIELPFQSKGRHIYNQFVVKVERGRDELRRYLSDHGIGSEIYYPVPLHAQECFQYLGYLPGDCPVSMEAAAKTIALPIYPELRHDQIGYIVEQIGAFFGK